MKPIFNILLVAVLSAGTAGAQSTDAVRAVYIQKQLQRDVGPYLNTLNAPPTVVSAINSFLLSRAEACANVLDVGRQQKLPPASISSLLLQARTTIDSQIDYTFDSSTAALVRELIHNYVGYSQICCVYVPHMSAAGVSLTDTQMRALANTLYNCNSALVTSNAPVLRVSVDTATGLSALDMLVLGQAADYLSPAQLAVLKTDLISRTHTLVSAKS